MAINTTYLLVPPPETRPGQADPLELPGQAVPQLAAHGGAQPLWDQRQAGQEQRGLSWEVVLSPVDNGDLKRENMVTYPEKFRNMEVK